jgi:hypothetical protein
MSGRGATYSRHDNLQAVYVMLVYNTVMPRINNFRPEECKRGFAYQVVCKKFDTPHLALRSRDAPA